MQTKEGREIILETLGERILLQFIVLDKTSRRLRLSKEAFYEQFNKVLADNFGALYDLCNQLEENSYLSLHEAFWCVNKLWVSIVSKIKMKGLDLGTYLDKDTFISYTIAMPKEIYTQYFCKREYRKIVESIDKKRKEEKE